MHCDGDRLQRLCTAALHGNLDMAPAPRIIVVTGATGTQGSGVLQVKPPSSADHAYG